MKAYLIPGLGADKRMYQPQLQILPDAVVLEHLPAVRGQTLGGYAQRLVPLIDTTKPFILIGTSLGGMIAQELSQYVRPEAIILLASVKGRHEFPMFIRAMNYLNLHKLVSGNFYKGLNGIMVRRLDSRKDSSAARLIREMTMDASPEFISWAVNAVIRWRPTPFEHVPVIHIHGTNDQLFPFSKIEKAIPVKNGSHVMNITMSAEVNRILKDVLANLNPAVDKTTRP